MIAAYQHGIYPRSEALVAATRDRDRGRASDLDVERRLDDDLASWLDVQKRAGLDYLSDGMFGWQDLFRPLVEASEGLRAGPMVRWFDNNSFFRTPQVTGRLSLAAGFPPSGAGSGAAAGTRVACLPSPYLFSRAAAGRDDRNALMLEVARSVLRPAAERMVAAGASLIHLQEPWLVYHGIDRTDWEPFSESLRLVSEGLGAAIALHTYFGDAAPWAERLRGLPVSAVGIDFIETDVEALGSGWEVGILAGCLDGRNSLVESVESITDLVGRLQRDVAPPAITLTSNCDLEFLPETVARKKVERLGEAARRLRETAA